MEFADNTGTTYQVFGTKALAVDIERHKAKYCCTHNGSETPLRRRIVAGGGVHIVRQCVRCGASVCGAIKQTAEHNNLLPFDGEIRQSFEAQKSNDLIQIFLRHLALQRTRRAEHQIAYAAYLASLGWAAKRSKVIKRANSTCEGCGEKPAAEVHHLTYKHIYDEPLFELVALCRSCHSRLHGEGDEKVLDYLCEEVD